MRSEVDKHLENLRVIAKNRRLSAEYERWVLAQLWKLGASDQDIADALGCTKDGARIRRARAHNKEEAQ